MATEKTSIEQVHPTGDHDPERKTSIVNTGPVLADDILMNDAIDGENNEHAMTVWQAAKTYPWACFWAFMMCFTIVCLSPPSISYSADRRSGDGII